MKPLESPSDRHAVTTTRHLAQPEQLAFAAGIEHEPDDGSGAIAEWPAVANGR